MTVSSIRWRAFFVIATLVLAGVLATGGCVTPAKRIDRLAAELRLVRQVVQGTRFQHVIYFATRGDPTVLHVYLEGDGSPWVRPHQIANDPTPRRPIMFELLAFDSAQTLYLGRPCYHGQVVDPACTPWVWTHGRYSETVVDSLAAALRSFLQHREVRRLRFFGFSGGGALAVLLARRFRDTEAVVTVAGNLDTAAWTRHHGYSELVDSINPASIPPLGVQVRQLHLLGLRDKTVPPALVEQYLQRQSKGEIIRYPEFDHRCCWRDIWPSLLAMLQ